MTSFHHARHVSVDQRRAQVLERLWDARGAWVPGPSLCTVHCGGSEGLRRLRELREIGYRIEHRKMTGHDSYEYRLLDGTGIASEPEPAVDQLPLFGDPT